MCADLAVVPLCCTPVPVFWWCLGFLHLVTATISSVTLSGCAGETHFSIVWKSCFVTSYLLDQHQVCHSLHELPMYSLLNFRYLIFSWIYVITWQSSQSCVLHAHLCWRSYIEELVRHGLVRLAVNYACWTCKQMSCNTRDSRLSGRPPC